MNYIQTVNKEDTTSSHELVVSLFVYIERAFTKTRSPFIVPNLLQSVWYTIRVRAVLFVAFFVPFELLVADSLRVLGQCTPETRRLLEWLTDQGYVGFWRINALKPGMPSVSHVTLFPKHITNDSHTAYTIAGSAGSGTGWSVEEAMLPAMGELVERYAASEWGGRSDMISGTQEMVNKNHTVFDIASLSFFTDVQKEQRVMYTEDSSVAWLPARNMHTNKKVLLPASITYLFYNQSHQSEPFLNEVNTNGVAAHTTEDEAVCRATLELVERDAFLLAWYQSKTCPQITHESISLKWLQYKSIFDQLAKKDVELHIVDITSDTEIPTIAAVCIHPGDERVTISMAAGCDIEIIIDKTLRESLRFLHSSTLEITSERKKGITRRRYGR